MVKKIMHDPLFLAQKSVDATEEGCLSLKGVRPCTRYQEIEVDYLDQNFKKQHGKYSGWTAQIIHHEIDHCNGIVIQESGSACSKDSDKDGN